MMVRRIVCGFALLIVAALPKPAQVVKSSGDDPVERALGWMKGDWICSGTFVRSGKSIVTDTHIENTLEGSRILLRQDDRPPNLFHALTFWGWSKDRQRFTSRLLDSAGGDRLFTSSGWDGDSLTWIHEPEMNSPQRFVFVRKGAAFGYHFDVQRDGQWVTVDNLECKH